MLRDIEIAATTLVFSHNGNCWRYIQTFGRVVMLTLKGLRVSEIAFAVGISEPLATEYLDLYRQYDLPEYQERLTEIVQMVSGGVREAARMPKKGAS